MTSPTHPTWRAAVARGIEIASSRKAHNQDVSYNALYKDFFNSCQNVPLKWLKDFTFEVEQYLLTNQSNCVTIQVSNKE